MFRTYLEHVGTILVELKQLVVAVPTYLGLDHTLKYIFREPFLHKCVGSVLASDS